MRKKRNGRALIPAIWGSRRESDMDGWNPYEELGVAAAASASEIGAARRKRAKQTHPDTAGGDAEAFRLCELAFSVLSDPDRRAKFDKTGVVDDDSPDNDRAAALQVIERHLSDLLNGYIKADFHPSHDPRHVDVVGEMRTRIRKEIANLISMEKIGHNAEAFYADVAKRFSTKKVGDDPLGRAMRDRVQFARKQSQTIKDGLRVNELALSILADYSFESVPPPPAAPRHSFRL